MHTGKDNLFKRYLVGNISSSHRNSAWDTGTTGSLESSSTALVPTNSKMLFLNVFQRYLSAGARVENNPEDSSVE